MVSRVEKNQARNHKPKRKVSELDETAARRRRTQTCLAQRAFRQRNKDTIASLNAQVTDLHKTIEKLNACFLTFTDDLVASGWLEQDPQVTKSLQGTIEQFITVVRGSHVLKEDNATASDDSDSGSAAAELRVPDGTQHVALLPVNKSTFTISGTGMNSNTMMIQELYATFNKSHNAAASELKGVIQPMRNTVISGAPNRPTSSQKFPYEFVPAHNDTFTYMPQLPRSTNLFKLSFAQKLHMEAIQAGLRLVSTAEDSSQLFFRVFNRVLDFSTRESYRARLNRVLDENFNQSLQPPPESDLDKLWSGGESCLWLNASDVASHFRSIGMDFDSSLDIVNVEITPPSLPNTLHNTQDLSSARLVTLGSGGFTESQHQQPPHDVACLSSTTYQHFTGAAQDAHGFGIYTTDTAYSSRGYGKSFMSVDVSRLIQEIVRGTRCYERNPTFNRNDLNVALARAVAQTH